MSFTDMNNHSVSQKKWTQKHPQYQKSWREAMRNDFWMFFKHKYGYVKARCLGQVPDANEYTGMEFMSKAEWLDFVQSNRSTLEPMFDNWRFNGYKRKDCPTIDRIDTAKGYFVENCRWIKQSENSRLGGIASGISRKMTALRRRGR